MRQVPGLRLIDLLDQRRFYLAVALLFGVPGLVLGATLAGLGVAVGMGQTPLGGMPPPLFTAGWALAGLLGLLAWVRLSWAWTTAGRGGLQGPHPSWWWLLGLGVAAALAMVGVVVLGIGPGRGDAHVLLLAGPPVLVPAAVLYVQRGRARRERLQ